MSDIVKEIIKLLDEFDYELNDYVCDNKYFMVDNHIELAKHLVANGVTVQKCGHWIVLGVRLYGGGKQYTHYCSECGQHGYDEYNCCPNCGAQMEARRYQNEFILQN